MQALSTTHKIPVLLQQKLGGRGVALAQPMRACLVVFVQQLGTLVELLVLTGGVVRWGLKKFKSGNVPGLTISQG